MITENGWIYLNEEKKNPDELFHYPLDHINWKNNEIIGDHLIKNVSSHSIYIDFFVDLGHDHCVIKVVSLQNVEKFGGYVKTYVKQCNLTNKITDTQFIWWVQLLYNVHILL